MFITVSIKLEIPAVFENWTWSPILIKPTENNIWTIVKNNQTNMKIKIIIMGPAPILREESDPKLFAELVKPVVPAPRKLETKLHTTKNAIMVKIIERIIIIIIAIEENLSNLEFVNFPSL